MTDAQINLPTLGPADLLVESGQSWVEGWTIARVQDYARAAVIADRAARDKDAERYRWLRRNSGDLARIADYATEEPDEEVWANGMDDYIDDAITAAMEKDK